jgi:hypothetical protein
LRHLVSYDSSDTLSGSWRLDHYGVLPEPPQEQALVMQRLQSLVPQEDGARSVQWTVEGVTGDDVARALVARCRRPVVVLHA